MTADTLDTDSIAAAGLTFSNANLTVVGPAGASLSAPGIAQAVEGKKAGKWVVSFTMNVSSGNNDSVGITTSTGIGFSFIGGASVAGPITWGYYNTNGSIVNSNAGQAAVNNTTYIAADRIDIAIDLDNKRLWFRKNAGSWIGTSGTPNPATNTGGFDITSALANNGRVYPALNLSGATSKYTADFSTGAGGGSVPAGFTAGWTNTTSGTYFGSLLVQSSAVGITGANGVPIATTGPTVSKYVSTLTGSVSTVVTSVSVGVTGTAWAVIYDATGASGGPGALLGISSNSVTNPALGEMSFSFSGVNVTSGVTYWVGISTSAQFDAFAAALTTGIYIGNTAFATSTHPNPFVIAGGSTVNGRMGALVFVTPLSSTRHQLLFS